MNRRSIAHSDGVRFWKRRTFDNLGGSASEVQPLPMLVNIILICSLVTSIIAISRNLVWSDIPTFCSIQLLICTSVSSPHTSCMMWHTHRCGFQTWRIFRVLAAKAWLLRQLYVFALGVVPIIAVPAAFNQLLIRYLHHQSNDDKPERTLIGYAILFMSQALLLASCVAFLCLKLYQQHQVEKTRSPNPRYVRLLCVWIVSYVLSMGSQTYGGVYFVRVRVGSQELENWHFYTTLLARFKSSVCIANTNVHRHHSLHRPWHLSAAAGPRIWKI